MDKEDKELDKIIKMDDKYLIIIENVVRKLSEIYNNELRNATNDYEYYAVMHGALVFKDIIENEFKEEIEGLGDDPDDIYRIMEAASKRMGASIRDRINKKLN
jgi:bacterioferritin (cytochrome b1)